MKKKPRIVIDARMYGLENAGIGRYVTNLVQGLELVEVEAEFFVLLRRKYYQKLVFRNERIKKILADYGHYSWQEQIKLPWLLCRLKPDLTHFLHFNAPLLWWGRQVVTLHDLIKHYWRGSQTTTRQPLFYWLKYLAYRLLSSVIIRRSKKIITPSFFWQKELVEKYGLKKSKIVVIYEGVDPKFQKEQGKRGKRNKQILKSHRLKKPFVIYTGSLYPHKNVLSLAKAVKLINETKRRGLVLAIACARNIFYERFKKQLAEDGLLRNVRLLGFVSDEELCQIYGAAEAFVFPSFLEGFGLPGLEAMSVGLPVIAANSSCLPEIYGSAALFFDPNNVEEMATKIDGVVASKKLQEKMGKAGKKRAAEFSWQKTVQATLAVYQKALA